MAKITVIHIDAPVKDLPYLLKEAHKAMGLEEIQVIGKSSDVDKLLKKSTAGVTPVVKGRKPAQPAGNKPAIQAGQSGIDFTGCKNLTEAIKRVMRIKQLSAAKFCAITGLNKNFVYFLRTGRSKGINNATKNKMRKAWGMPGCLWGDKDKPKPVDPAKRTIPPEDEKWLAERKRINHTRHDALTGRG